MGLHLIYQSFSSRHISVHFHVYVHVYVHVHVQVRVEVFILVYVHVHVLLHVPCAHCTVREHEQEHIPQIYTGNRGRICVESRNRFIVQTIELFSTDLRIFWR
jgi:hypothetical protein